MIPALNIHYSRASDLLHPDLLRSEPTVPVAACRDQFDNWRSRIVAPPGRFLFSADPVVSDSGLPDLVARAARQIAVVQLAESTLAYLMGSRCCETDQLSEVAWQRFSDGPTGWGRVQAICDFVNGHIDFG